MKRTGRLERRTRLKRGRRAPSPGTREQRERFKTLTLAAYGGRCAVEDDGYCEGDVQAHHVTPQEKIRQWARARRLDDESLASLLWDPANGLAACRRHHDRHTLATRRIPLDAVRQAARDFARGLGLEHLLDVHYRKPDETKEARPC